MIDLQKGTDPFGWFEQLARAHEQFATLMLGSLAAAPIDERSKGQWAFAMRQVMDAINPKNGLATKPEAMQLALQSGGGGGETQFVLGASGHIAGVINPPAKRKRNYWTAGLQPDAPAWLESAQSVDGSWWPAWTEWLGRHAGALAAAPRRAGNADFPVIEPAPGRYVKERAE